MRDGSCKFTFGFVLKFLLNATELSKASSQTGCLHSDTASLHAPKARPILEYFCATARAMPEPWAACLYGKASQLVYLTTLMPFADGRGGEGLYYSHLWQWSPHVRWLVCKSPQPSLFATPRHALLCLLQPQLLHPKNFRNTIWQHKWRGLSCYQVL